MSTSIDIIRNHVYTHAIQEHEGVGDEQDAAAFSNWITQFAVDRDTFNMTRPQTKDQEWPWGATWNIDNDAVYVCESTGICYIIPFNSAADMPQVRFVGWNEELRYIDNTIVTLYQDVAGKLFIGANGADHTWDVTHQASPAGFHYDGVALLNGDTSDWTIDRVPLSVLDNADTRAIATLDERIGQVHVHRDDNGRILAGPAGRRYIGYLEEE